MDYEEAYLEALERAKAGKPMDEVFPELKESEDERIRKYIQNELACLRATEDKGSERYNELSSAIAYLEKQKEHLPVPDKFSGLKSLMLQYLQSAANRKDDTEIESDTDLFGRKILDYVWKYSDEQKEQKPAEWSKEDEKGVTDTIAKYEQKEQKLNIELIQRSWYLEGYYDRKFGKEPKWIIKTGEDGPEYEENPKYGQMFKEQKPADYDHEMWKNCEVNFEGGKKEVINNPEKYGLCKFTEWSEEDERFIKELCNLLASIAKNNYVGRYYAPDLISKLQSLRPQPHWKPSEEQIKALKHCVNGWQDTANGVLESLYNDLQKLL